MLSLALVCLAFLTAQAYALLTSDTPAQSLNVSTLYWTHEDKNPLEARDHKIGAGNYGGGWVVTAQVGADLLTLNLDTGSSDL